MKTAFVINPISGTRKDKEALPDLIMSTIDKSRFEPVVVMTEHAGHGVELARQFAAEGYGAVVAVGGDGTVNEVASGLRDTQTALGIIPIGSGDGLARHLHISRNPRQAVEALNTARIEQIDYGVENGRPFFTTCGTGFDAYIADCFARAGERGLSTYNKTMVHEFFGYKRRHYRIKGDGIDLDTEAFLVTFANAGQWGNNAYIAPKASVQDGLMDVVVVNKIPVLALPVMATMLFTKSIGQGVYVHIMRAQHVTLERTAAEVFHCDGDPHAEDAVVDVSIVHHGLHALITTDRHI